MPLEFFSVSRRTALVFLMLIASVWGNSSGLATYVVADERDNEGNAPGQTDGVCVYSGNLAESQALNLTSTLLASFAPVSHQWATIPHPLNHSSTVLLNCTDLMLNVDQGLPGYCKYCKEYAVCAYGSCLHGALVNDRCCSLLSSTENIPKCNDISLPYDPVTRTLASCEFNYELYDFGSSGTPDRSASIMVFSTVLIVLVMVN